MDIGFSFGRFIASLIITAAVSIIGVWTVVGLAVSGMTSAVEVSNRRIDDINSKLDKIDGRIQSISESITEMRVELASGFRDTRNEILKKRASAEGTEPPIMETVTYKVFSSMLIAELAMRSAKEQRRLVGFSPSEELFERAGLAAKLRYSVDAQIEASKLIGELIAEQPSGDAWSNAALDAEILFKSESGANITLTRKEDKNVISGITAIEGPVYARELINNTDLTVIEVYK